MFLADEAVVPAGVFAEADVEEIFLAGGEIFSEFYAGGWVIDCRW